MIEENTTNVQIKIGAIQADETVPDNVRKSQVDELKRSLNIDHGQDSSFKVVTNLANTMIGSSVIVYPILFVKDGMLGSLIVLLVIGAALFCTCRLLVVHNRRDEVDFGVSIKRVLGNRWAKLNSWVNIILVYIVSVVYFMLICGNFFSVTSTIAQEFGYKPPQANNLTFNKWSRQYASIVCVAFVAPFIWKRDIEALHTFFKYTIYLVFLYGIFVLASFIRVLAQGILHFGEFKLFDSDFSTVAGAFALSMLIHPVGAPILKRGANQDNNMRDLFLGYCLTALIYVFVGFVGGMTCAESVEDILHGHPEEYSTVFDCVIKGQTASSKFFYYFGSVVQLGIFVQNLSVMPILSFLTRKEFLDQVTNEAWKPKAFHAYNGFMMFCCFIVTFLEVDVSIVLSLNGAIVGFFMAYAIPIATHLGCYHKKLNKEEQEERAESLLSVNMEDADDETIGETLKCNDHPPRSFIRHVLIYGGLTVMGVAVGVLKLIAFFS